MEKKINEKKILLKSNPDLYKIRIGKKKTGFPNFDYPPIISSNKIKKSNFTILSIEYDEIHLDNLNDKENNVTNNKLDKSKNKTDISIKNKFKNLNEKLIGNSNNSDQDLNFNSTIEEKNDLKFIKPKKCCDKCLIF